jgi:hypothetical protein
MTARAFAWPLCVLSLASITTGMVMEEVIGGIGEADVLEHVGLLIAFSSFPVLGAVIASRQHRNAIGWLFIAMGLSVGVLLVATEYARWALVVDPAPRTGRVLAAWIEQWLWYPWFGFIALIFLLFPDGRPPSPRWRWLVGVVLLLLVPICVLGMVEERLESDGYSIRNPIGIDGLGDVETVGSFLFLLFGPVTILCVASLFFRFRGAGHIQRQQLKLLAFSASLVLLVTLLGEFLNLPGVFLPLALITVPGSITVAILRYHLYDIDRIINRTIVYALVTGSALAVYAGTVFVVGTVVVGPSDNLTVAVATLAAAAVFRPALSRVQAFVDRRFYRHKYDAQHTIEAFGTRLREETNLDELTDDLVAVVRRTMQPEHVSVWLRTEGSRL